MKRISFFYKILLCFSFLFSSPPVIIAQQKTIQYDKDFTFRDGIYFTFLDFKNNNPIPAAKIVSNYNKNDRDFFSSILSKTSFMYLDGFGKETEFKSDDIWGYCSNGTIYINHGTDFNRVTIIGSICHFVATVQMKVGVSDPFMYNQGYGNTPRYKYVTEQFILDFETGTVLTFDVAQMEVILQRDEALYKEFEALKRKEKRDGIFLYLRKYNAKHPIYFAE
jgi:hypothetical protein